MYIEHKSKLVADLFSTSSLWKNVTCASSKSTQILDHIATITHIYVCI